MATSNLRRTCRQLDGWVEPLQAWRMLRADGRPALLLDGMGDHPHARYAYLAHHPATELRIHGNQITYTDAKGTRTHTGEPLQALAELAANHHFDIDELEGFTGGLVGMLGYEFARAIEPTLPPPKKNPETPDAVVWVCRDAMVFDRQERTVTLYASDLPEEGGDSCENRIESDLQQLATQLDSHPDVTIHLRESPKPPEPSATPGANVMLDDTVPLSAEDLPDADAVPPTSMAPSGNSPATRTTLLAPPQPSHTSPAWKTSMDQATFEATVQRVQDQIRTGDLFQANIATRWTTNCHTDPAQLFESLQNSNPSPYMALLDFDDFQVVSGSPEQLFAVQNGIIQSRPIAGTRPRGHNSDEDLTLEEELLADPKERAEHTMLVDLVRNDVARISVPGTVRVAERMSVERYRHVMHLVSRVEGNIRPGTTFSDWVAALFPGGTITGAPKHRACLRIHESEPVPRGPYTGSAGYLSWSHNAHWNILIRTLVLQDGRASVHAGSGIVMASNPTREWQEAGHKARSLLEAATHHQHTTGNPEGVGSVRRHGTWTLEVPEKRVPEARVLLIDNYDSFTHNLADYCAALGAQVHVIRNDADWQKEAQRFDPTHLIVGPGPGRPEDAGCSIEAIQQCSGKIPVLGVCLGHQAIAIAFGGSVHVHHEAVHGHTDTIHHDGTGILTDLPSPLEATRYHSLVVAPHLPPTLRANAHLSDGTMMALRHHEHATTGLQFHPESLCTGRGIEIALRFLEERCV